MSKKKAKRAPVDQWSALGAGAYGRVTRARVAGLGYDVAVKWIPIINVPGRLTGKMDLDEEDEPPEEDDGATEYSEAVDEFVVASLLGMSKAPAFLHIHGAFLASFTSSMVGLPAALVPLVPTNLAQQYYLVLVSEYADRGTLKDILLKGQSFTALEAGAILFDLAWSLMLAHSQVGLRFHGDLQSGNLAFIKTEHPEPITYELVDILTEREMGRWSHPISVSALRPCIIDLGFASYMVPGKPDVLGKEVTLNTPPELYFDRPSRRSDRVDVWQLGVVLFSLFAKQPAGLAEIRRSPIPLYGEDKKLHEAVYSCAADLIDYPVCWLNGLAKLRNVTPPLADEDEGEDLDPFAAQVDIDKRFVRLIPDLDPCTGKLAEALLFEKTNGRKYARYVSIGLLQEVLGNGWCPPPRHSAEYASSSFYKCLQDARMQRFWARYLLPPMMPLRALVTTMVEGMPPSARLLLKHMLSWNPNDRPSCESIVMNPWFKAQFPQPPVGEEVMYRAHARPPLAPTFFGATPPITLLDEEAVRHWHRERELWVIHQKWLSSNHTKLRGRFNKMAIADTLAEMEHAIDASVS